VMLAYNLMSLFKRVVVKSSRNQAGQARHVHQTLKNLRYKIFAKPAYITQDGRRRMWNLVMGMQKREWIQGMWDAAHAFDIPVHFTPQPCG
jgi:hypothetical protein